MPRTGEPPGHRDPGISYEMQLVNDFTKVLSRKRPAQSKVLQGRPVMPLSSAAICRRAEGSRSTIPPPVLNCLVDRNHIDRKLALRPDLVQLAEQLARLSGLPRGKSRPS
jgi:hypothetical protein